MLLVSLLVVRGVLKDIFLFLIFVFFVSQVFVFELERAFERKISGLTSFDSVSYNLLKGQTNLASSLNCFGFVDLGKLLISDPGTVVRVPADTLQSLNPSDRVRESSQDKHRDSLRIVFTSEVQTSATKLFTDHEDGESIVLLHVHVFKFQVGSLRVNFLHDSFFFKCLVIFSVRIDEDAALQTFFMNKGPPSIKAPKVTSLMNSGVVVIFLVTILVDLTLEFLQYFNLASILLTFIRSGSQTNDEDVLMLGLFVKLRQIPEHSLI